MSIIVILNFCCWWWWLYIYFSVQQCTVMKKPFCFIVGFHFYGYAVCVLHVVLKHFGEKTWDPSPGDLFFFLSFFLFFFFFNRLIPTVFSSWYPLGLTSSLPVKIAVIESRHGTTHCLNTVDHSRWSQETHPVEKNRPWNQGRSAKSSSHPDGPKSAAPLRFFFHWWTTFSLV